MKAMCEDESAARLEVRCDFRLVDISLLLIRGQHHDDVACCCSLSRSHNLQTVVLSLLLVLGARAQTYYNVYTGAFRFIA